MDTIELRNGVVMPQEGTGDVTLVLSLSSSADVGDIDAEKGNTTTTLYNLRGEAVDPDTPGVVIARQLLKTKKFINK